MTVCTGIDFQWPGKLNSHGVLLKFEVSSRVSTTLKLQRAVLLFQEKMPTQEKNRAHFECLQNRERGLLVRNALVSSPSDTAGNEILFEH